MAESDQIIQTVQADQAVQAVQAVQADQADQADQAEQTVQILEDSSFQLTCPNCGGYFIVYPNQINCRIFRHGVYKHNREPMNPHASKSECDNLLLLDNIYGCAGPFEMIYADGVWKTAICGYDR